MHTFTKKTSLGILALCVSLFVTTSAQASLYHPGGNQAAIDYGATFDAVGYNAIYDGDNRFFGGSNVLIAPNIVLTAGHAAVRGDTPAGGLWDNYLVGFGANIQDDINVNAYAVSDVILHPGFTGIESIDLALLILEIPVIGIDPVVIFEGSNPSVNTILHGAGYGNHAEVNGTPDFDGNRRAWDTHIDAYGSIGTPDNNVMTEFASPSDINYQVLGGSAYPGDSGGGLFVDTPTGLELLAITAFGWKDNLNYGVRVGSLVLNESERLWLNDNIAEYGVEVPEPASLVLLVGGIGFMGRRKKMF